MAFLALSLLFTVKWISICHYHFVFCRVACHMFQINNGGKQLLYKHFNSHDHSILSMTFRILGKIYQHTNCFTWSTSFRWQREDYWNKNLGTVFSYECNLGNLTAPQTNVVNVIGLFAHRERCKRSSWTSYIYNTTYTRCHLRLAFALR
jgi:hypothetical protein